MKVSELIAALQKCDQEATVEYADATSIDDVCYHSGQQRVSLGNYADRISEDMSAVGWEYLHVSE